MINIDNYRRAFLSNNLSADLPWLRSEIEKWFSHAVLFRATREMFEMMSHVHLTIPLESYRQPYSHVMVDFPDGISVLCMHTSSHGIVISTKDRALTTTVTISTTADPQMQLEDVFTSPLRLCLAAAHEGELVHVRTFVDQIPKAIALHMRAAMNLCLLLANSPHMRVHGERERQLRRRANRGTREQRVAAQRQLRLLPQVIGFQSAPVLFRHEGDPQSTGTPGAMRRPHWRCGHWRNQAHGPSWQFHRQIFICPVLIHSEVATGEANITYNVR